jgi:hypothetical protein
MDRLNNWQQNYWSLLLNCSISSTKIRGLNLNVGLLNIALTDFQDEMPHSGTTSRGVKRPTEALIDKFLKIQ